MLVEMEPSAAPIAPQADPARSEVEVRIRFPSDQRAVRSALGGVLQGLNYVDLPSEVRGVLELVLAEALNNVVIHAHAHRPDGVIEVRVLHDASGKAPVLTCELIDDGVPMPDGQAPRPCSVEIEGDTALLPEGGFGWMLIRELARDVDYRRTDGRNRLTFQLDAADAPQD